MIKVLKISSDLYSKSICAGEKGHHDERQKRLRVMDPLSGTYADALFSSIPQQQAQFENLAGFALSRGIDLYMNGDYEGAVKEFRRATGLAPYSENSLDAYDYMANAYLELNKVDDAIKAYQASLEMFPLQDDIYLKLGNLYFSQERYNEAENEYKKAIRLNPHSSDNIYSLGQVYLVTGRYGEAETQFSQVIHMEPEHYGGYYALGQTYSGQGQYVEAVEQFEKSIRLDNDFAYAYADLGYAYADMGETEKAQDQVNRLEEIDSSLADLLEDYIYENSAPKFLFVYNTSGFLTSLGPGTPLTDIDDSFSTPDTSNTYTMKFIFSKDMNMASVLNPYNWKISRADGSNVGGAYNYGLSIPSTEIEISSYPLYVTYDPDTFTAEVTFGVTQNDSADGTIDPSHIVFSFSGEDAYGNSMDSSADEYSGISLIV